MGRTIVADERVQKIIDGYKVENGCGIGLLIGQMTSQRDYAIHLCETPKGEGGSDAAKAGTDPKNIDEHWVATHAKQVLYMLPGGLDILGIYIISSQETMTNVQIHLRKVLNAVQKMVDKCQALIPDTCVHTDRIVLQICIHTKKITCRTYDVADIKSVARPADWKVQSVLSGWINVESSFSMDHNIPINLNSMSQTPIKQIQTGLGPLLESVGSCLGIFDGKLSDPYELINNPPSGTHSKKSKKNAASKSSTDPSTTTQVQLLMQTPLQNAENIIRTKCGAKMLLKGTMSGRAYIHGKSTFHDALQALKRDFCRSLLARCELLCEDLLQAEEEQDPRVLYETPVRILGRIPGSPLHLCDYMFQDEVEKDSMDRFKEILGLVLSEEDLNTALENVPSEDLLVQLNEVFPAAVEENAESSPKRRIYDTVGIVGSAFAVVAALVYYMFLGDQ